MRTLLDELMHALRIFRDSPGFAAAAVAVLTLGIAANTAIFSIYNGVVLKPIPFDEPDQLLRLLNTQNGEPAGPAMSPAKFMHFRAQSDVLEDVAAYRFNSLNYTSGDVPERVTDGQVTEGYFRALRAPVLLGRTFTPDEDLPGGPKTVVLSYNFWQRRLAGDPNVLGRTLHLSGENYTVIGVVGPEFDVREFGAPELWTAFQLSPDTTDQGHYFQAVGRLRDGVTLREAQARIEASTAQFKERFPDALNKEGGLSVIRFADSVGRSVRSSIYMFFGAVAFVLLIACANVANLLLVRANGRNREIAIRSALGAGRGRIVRQLLLESIVLSVAGGALGLAVGFFGIRALLSMTPLELPRLGGFSNLAMDWRVVAFALGLSVVTGVVFGLIPALIASRADLNAVIKDSAGRAGSGFKQNKARAVLVMLEVALAVVLLVGAALLIRTSIAIGDVDPGFNAKNVLVMRTALTGPQFLKAEAVDRAARVALERVRALPGVAAATATCCVPLQGGYGLPFNIIGRENDGPFTGGGSWTTTSPGYFETFEIPLVRGRAFTDLDAAGAPPVAIINQAFARQYWPDGDPLGQQILIGGGAKNMSQLADEPVREIIAIAADVRAQGLAEDPRPSMYVPQAQVPDALNALNVGITPMAWIVRTRGDPAALSKSLEETIRQATGLPVSDVQTMEQIVAIAASRHDVATMLMSIFGGAALLLAAIGIYGLMAYSVQQRTQEIGIRMALGAEPGRVRALVIRQAMALVAIGVALGLIGAFFLAKLLAAFLFGVEARDVAVFVGVPLVLTAVALASVALPAHRASCVDPLEALRYQ